MNFLLDTNICIYLIKGRPESVVRELQKHAVGDVGVSTITVAELYVGTAKSQARERSLSALQQFLAPLALADFDSTAAAMYGDVRAYLEKNGTPIGSLDTLIAAHALSLDVTLVTNNEREFRRVPGLQVVNWAVG